MRDAWSAAVKPRRVGPFGLALACGASLASVQMPAAGAALIYGRINTGIERTDLGGAPTGRALTRLSNYRSVVGFRGEEALDGGLKVVWQIEGGFALDTGVGSIASRDTRVGLSGALGTVFLGVWTLPYTSATSGFDPFYPTTAGYMAIMGNGSAPSTDNVIDTASFDRRQRNQVQYWTPVWSGLSARVAYGFNEETVAATGAKPSLFSAAVSYEAGEVTLTAAHERHHEYQAASTTDTASKLGVAYRFGGARLAAVFERLEYETATGSLERHAWYVSGTYRLGSGSLRIGYARAANGKGSATETIGFFRSGSNTGARQLTVGYEHELSRRTAVFAFYSRIDNDAAAIHDFAINALGVGAGQRPGVVSLGLRHSF